MMGYGMMGGFGWIGLLLYLAFIVGFVVLVVWVVKRFSGQGSFQSPGQSPREILQVRYAKGEITREQFQQMLGDLN